MTKRIVVLSTGGTIASSRDASGRSVSGALRGEELVRQLALEIDLPVEVHSFLQKPSNAIDAGDLLQLRAQCLELSRDTNVGGIVITHGTDTLEDTAYFLQSTVPHDSCPIVVTGSQRVPHAMGSDALTNLASAITVAADKAVRGCGVLVVFNESIFSANDVRKVSTFQLHGFDAPGYGPLGCVDGRQVHLMRRPILPRTLVPGSSLPRVDLLTVTLGADPALLAAAADGGARGVVIEGVGRGHVPPDWMPAIEAALARRVVAVISSSCLHGPLAQAYEFAGSLHDLERAGVVRASGLSARKARMRLMAFLSGEHPDRALAELYR